MIVTPATPTPLFLALTVNTIELPGVTNWLLPETMVRVRVTGTADTVVAAVALLLPGAGSAVVVVTEAVLLITAPPAAVTLTANVKTSLADAASESLLQLTTPVLPTAGVIHAQPAAEVNDAKVTPAGRVSIINNDAAALGPLLATVKV